MSFKRLLPSISLVIGFLVLALIFQFRDTIKDGLAFNLGKLGIYFDNFFSPVGSPPKRSRPLSLLQKETELKLYIGEPFRDFNKADWEKFWNVIYGGFPLEDAPREGWPKKIRQLADDEIAEKLARLYPQPFEYFKEEHWKIFFQVISKR
jgi:hypothetical protein